jgi:hypothetical protein
VAIRLFVAGQQRLDFALLPVPILLPTPFQIVFVHPAKNRFTLKEVVTDFVRENVERLVKERG